MQGESSPQRDVLDVESLAGHLLPVGGVFRFLAEHRQHLFPDVLFADLFPSGRGRPSIPASVVASVIVLQALHGLSDREAVEALTRALTLIPGTPLVQAHLGLAQFKAGQRDEAKKNLQLAVSSGQPFPGLADARAALQQL